MARRDQLLGASHLQPPPATPVREADALTIEKIMRAREALDQAEHDDDRPRRK
jgi:hypothetical protein